MTQAILNEGSPASTLLNYEEVDHFALALRYSTPESLGGGARSGLSRQRKTTATTLGEWAELYPLLAPSIDHLGRWNCRLGWGAVDLQGKLKDKRYRNMMSRSYPYTLDQVTSSFFSDSLGGVAIAVEARKGVEVIDFDNSAHEGYHALRELLAENGMTPLLAVESGSANSLHLYVHRPDFIDRDDFLGWVTDIEEFVNAFCMVKGPKSRERVIEVTTNSSTRLPGSCSLKTRSWAKPVPTTAPFSGRYLTPSEAVDQVKSALLSLRLPVQSPGNNTVTSADEEELRLLSVPCISKTWMAETPWGENFVGKPCIALNQESHISPALSGKMSQSNDVDVAAMLDIAASASPSDTSLSFITALNSLWSGGVRDAQALHQAFLDHPDHPASAKPLKKGRKWTTARIGTFLHDKAQYAIDRLTESLPEGCTLASVETYYTHLTNMRKWLTIGREEGWEYELLWALARIFMERFANSWTGESVPLSNRDVQTFLGCGSSYASKVLSALTKDINVLSEDIDPHTPRATSQARRFTLSAAPETPSSEACSTVVITGGWCPSVDHPSGRVPLYHLCVHPSIVKSSGKEYLTLPSKGVPGFLLGQYNSVRERVLEERKTWYKKKTNPIISLVSLIERVPSGSPRAFLGREGSLSDWKMWEASLEGGSEPLLVMSGCEMDLITLADEAFEVSMSPRGP